MKIKTHSFIILFLSLIITISLTNCKKDSEKITDSDIEEGKADVVISMDIGINSFDMTGELEIVRDGEDITITGIYTVGNMVFEDVVFHGELIDDVFTMTTTNYEVQFEAGGTTYTENLTFHITEFSYDLTKADATGTIDAVQTPGGATETGTFTLMATKI